VASSKWQAANRHSPFAIRKSKLMVMNLLAEGARVFGLELSDEQLRAFEIYQTELLTWNAKFNLTSITTPDEIVSKHFLDSLSFFALVQSSRFDIQGSKFKVQSSESNLQPPTSNYQLLDIGAGAGFPSLPLKIVCPEWQVTLLEATRKKCEFLEHIVGKLGLQKVRVVWGRAEMLGRDANEREQYDVVVARAVAELNVLVEYMLPFARIGGYCVAWKGDMIVGEVNVAKNGIAKLGGALNAVKQVHVPDIEQKRHLVIIEKISRTDDAYPRREGVPMKKPLK
jgi:16S rRNA (guanine527-N7)-methyltransferase